MLKIKVPATTANLGPGFDAIGLALNLFNEITVEKAPGKSTFIWHDESILLTDEENLIITSMNYIFNKYKFTCDGYIIKSITCDIPVSRGLGSSASAIICGIVAANYLMGNTLGVEDYINISTEIEGHPDNVVPAILGGMVTSALIGDKVVYSKINVSNEIEYFALIPNFKLSTKVAREALPKEYSPSDLAFNISRVALLVSSFNNDEFHNLRYAFEDKMHQPYRLKLINDADKIFEKSKELMALGEFISGAGPTLLSLVHTNYSLSFESGMQSYLNDLEDNWKIKKLGVCTTGFTAEVM
jgi:homoserine kinase